LVNVNGPEPSVEREGALAETSIVDALEEGR
jgi:hypothetical protein